MTTNPMTLEGKTILITGANAGIGRATALLASRLGARLILVARNEDRLARTRAQLQGADHIVRSMDLDDCDGLHRFVRQLCGETRVKKYDKRNHPYEEWIVLDKTIGNHFLDCEVYSWAAADIAGRRKLAGSVVQEGETKRRRTIRSGVTKRRPWRGLRNRRGR